MANNSIFTVYLIYEGHTFGFKMEEAQARDLVKKYQLYKLNPSLNIVCCDSYCFDFSKCVGIYVTHFKPSAQERIANVQEEIQKRHNKPLSGDEWKYGKNDEDE